MTITTTTKSIEKINYTYLESPMTLLATEMTAILNLVILKAITTQDKTRGQLDRTKTMKSME